MPGFLPRVTAHVPKPLYIRKQRARVLPCHCGSVTRRVESKPIDWDQEREGYLDLPRPPTYAPVRGKQLTLSRSRFSIRTEEHFGGLIAAAGTIWAVYVATVDYSSLWQLKILPPGPIELCALGILAWLHAKWRRSTKTG